MHTVHKAGALIVRARSAENGVCMIEILCIHRPRYDDWSLPKGHIEPYESAEQAAIREALEETGFLCANIGSLPEHVYTLPSGDSARVSFFILRIVEEAWQYKDNEVDELRFVNIDEAIELISYPSLREYLDECREAVVSIVDERAV